MYCVVTLTKTRFVSRIRGRMDRRESLLLSIFLGGIIPLLSLVLFWWIGAGLSISQVLPIRESGIPVIALIGMAFGVVLDALYLKRWVPRIYEINLKVMAPIYLFASLIMLAFFMGMPLGNLALGTLAGVYIGRRANYTGEGHISFTKKAKRMGIFAAVLTSGESLPFALLSLTEPIIQELIGAVTGLDDRAISGWVGVILMIVVIILVAIIQYLLAGWAARIAYGIGVGNNTES